MLEYDEPELRPQASGSRRESRRTLLFYCQHSLGMGHLVRSLALCEALAAEYDVTLLCGGVIPNGVPTPPSVKVAALPPIRASRDFTLTSGDQRRSVEETFELRRDIIIEAFNSTRPSVVVIELYPFGRRRFGTELQSLLEVARRDQRATIVCSLRDILVRRRDQETYDDRARRVADEYIDAVLVHTDPQFARLEESFHPRAPMRTPVLYTGFVASPRHETAGRRARREPRIVVSAGSGTVGELLLRRAIEAQAEIQSTTGLRMRIIAGPLVDDHVWSELTALARDRHGLMLVRVVSDLAAELETAHASVSQCGYNTAVDVLRAGVPALIVPHPDGEEQVRRARKLEQRGLVRVIHPDRLSARALARGVRSLGQHRLRPCELDLDGARKTLDIIVGLDSHAKAARR